MHPSPIQWSALPMATKVGVDMMVQSKSGTGKTLVFVVTALNMVNTDLQAIQVPSDNSALAWIENTILTLRCLILG